jgi:hypothetical protein
MALVNSWDLTMSCNWIQRIKQTKPTGAVWVEKASVELSTFVDDAEYKFKQNTGTWISVPAKMYLFDSSCEVKAGDKLDGVPVVRVDKAYGFDGQLDHYEIYTAVL